MPCHCAGRQDSPQRQAIAIHGQGAHPQSVLASHDTPDRGARHSRAACGDFDSSACRPSTECPAGANGDGFARKHMHFQRPVVEAPLSTGCGGRKGNARQLHLCNTPCPLGLRLACIGRTIQQTLTPSCAVLGKQVVTRRKCGAAHVTAADLEAIDAAIQPHMKMHLEVCLSPQSSYRCCTPCLKAHTWTTEAMLVAADSGSSLEFAFLTTGVADLFALGRSEQR